MDAQRGATVDQFDWYADEARRIYGRMIDGHNRQHRLMVIRQPIGPVAAFVPWNFPALLAARKIAPAIAAGCSIIVKPPIEAPRTVLCLAQACHDAEVPAGVVNMVTGDSAHISEHLIPSGTIRKVSLTGSVPVGRKILRLCADQMIPASMELGGHSPVLVFEDADIENAAETCARGKFRNMGQVCIAASRSVLSSVDESMAVMTEELFGPIATFSDLDDALAKANRTEFGLAGYVFTRDTRTAFLASEGLDVGMVGVNNLVIATAEAPFGGVKHSGFGREGGSEGIEAYTVTESQSEPSGIYRSLTSYGDPDFSRYLRRAFLASAGYDRDDPRSAHGRARSGRWV